MLSIKQSDPSLLSPTIARFFKSFSPVKVSLLTVGISLVVACSTGSPESALVAEQKTPQVESTAQASSDLDIDYEKYQLENGLTVIFHQDNSAPMVHVNISYHVGSAREERGKTGFAHFFEHMMFQGSKHVGDQQFFKIINEAGGSLNGTTDKDRTQYFETVPSNQLEKVLWLESDRMGFLLDAVDQHKFEVQRSTVKNERGQRVDNKPYGLVSERNSEALYPREHPYSWQPIGYVEDLDRVSVDDLKDFFLTWYGPNNAVLTIGGDIEPQQTKAWVEKYFGPIKKGPEVKDAKPELVSLAADRYITLEDRINIPMMQISYPTVYLGHEDEARLDIFADILGGGKSSLLYKNLVETGLASSAGASHYCRELACTLAIWVMPANGSKDQAPASLAELEQAVDAAITEFKQRGVNAADIKRVHAALEASYIYSLETVNGRVRQLAFGELFEQEPTYMNKVLFNLSQVDEPAVNKVVAQYIADKPRLVLSVVPHGQAAMAAAMQNHQISERDLAGIKTVDSESLKYREIADTFDRSIQPPAGKAPEIALPNLWQSSIGTKQSHNLASVMGSYSEQTPTVSIVIDFIGGAGAEQSEQFGIAKLTAALLNQSSKNFSVSQISDELDLLGSQISFSSSLTHNRLEIKSLTKNLPKTMDLVKERLLNPAFDPMEFDLLKAQQLQSIKQNHNRPQWLSGMAFQQIIYGDDSRLRESTSGNLTSVNDISLDQVKQYYQQYYHPQGSSIAVVGKLNKEQTVASLSFMQDWQPATTGPAEVEITASAQLPASTIYLLDKPNAPQSVIQMGSLGVPYDATGTYFKLSLVNFNLGGNFNSRINQNLREDKAFTYGASSGFTGFKNFGSFSASAEVETQHTSAAIAEFLKEIKQFKVDGPKPEELTYLKQAYSQGEALAYVTPSQKSYFLQNLQRYHLKPDYVHQQNEITRDISAKELNTLAQQYLKPDELQIVVVGDKAKLLPQLQKLNLPIKEIEIAK